MYALRVQRCWQKHPNMPATQTHTDSDGNVCTCQATTVCLPRTRTRAHISRGRELVGFRWPSVVVRLFGPTKCRAWVLCVCVCVLQKIHVRLRTMHVNDALWRLSHDVAAFARRANSAPGHSLPSTNWPAPCRTGLLLEMCHANMPKINGVYKLIPLCAETAETHEMAKEKRDKVISRTCVATRNKKKMCIKLWGPPTKCDCCSNGCENVVNARMKWN